MYIIYICSIFIMFVDMSEIQQSVGFGGCLFCHCGWVLLGVWLYVIGVLLFVWRVFCVFFVLLGKQHFSKYHYDIGND